MRLIGRSLVLAGLLGLAAAGSAAAQSVRGRVVETTSGTGVGGGFVVLVGTDGKEAARTLADREGRFAIRAPFPGQYRLRSERIGFRMTVIGPVQLNAGETLEQDMVVNAVPVRLDEVRITAGETCKVKPEEGRATAVVWEEARKALAAVAWSQRQTRLRATVRKFERDVELDLTIRSESTSTRSGYTTRPFRARSAAQLAQEGYVTETPDTAFTFYAPDADVLFSDEFLNTHCLRLQAPDKSRPGRIGLAFEPVSRRPVSEIRGVMWLDEKSAELEAVEFRYVNTPLPAESDRAGGLVEFQQLVNGTWLVDYWYIRMPMFSLVERGDPVAAGARIGTSTRLLSTPDRRGEVDVVGFREEGGEVLDIFDADGQRLAGTAGATLSGSVFDSTRSTPLIGATVRVVGTGYTVKTGPGGTFRLDRLPEGLYQLEFFHEEFPAWDVIRPGVTADLKRGVVTETRLALPPTSVLVEALCPGMLADTTVGATGGKVTALDTGAPVDGALVQVTWKSWDLKGEDTGERNVSVLSRSTGLQTTTDETGYFRLCGVPANHPLEAQVVIGNRTTPAVGMQVVKGDLKELNFVVTKP